MLIRVMWAISSHLVTTDAAAKALAAEANLASLANDVANLKAGIFAAGLTLGGAINTNGHNVDLHGGNVNCTSQGGAYN
jgi:hypothetical protein